MTFGAPGYLFLLLLLPAAIGAVIGWSVWRHRALRRLGAPHAPARSYTYVVPLLLVVALACAAVAAARPRAGSHETPVPARGIDVVIVLDVSQSMLADDTPPTRLGRAQLEIDALLARLSGDRVGLVIFAGSSFVRAPLTSDVRALREIVDGVDRERGLVAPGSDLGSAINAGRGLLAAGDAPARVMLIVSDGEDHGAGVTPAVAAARGDGVRIFTAGSGTSDGAPVRDLDPVTGAATVRLDATGAPIITRLDDDALRDISTTGGGRYVGLSGDGQPLKDLAADFDSLNPATLQGPARSTPIERGRFVAGVALLVLLVATLFPLLLSVPRGRRALRWLPVAGAGLLVSAICTAGVASVNRRGNDAYEAGDYAGAVALYATAQALDPSRAEPYYNAGNAYERNGDNDSAIAQTKRALNTGDPLVRAPAEYALGNHSAAAGRYADAADAYRRALLADPADDDAKHNLELVNALLHATPTPRPSEIAPTPPSAGTPGPPTSGTPDATDEAGSGQRGTPRSADPRSLPPDELQQQLEEALAGLDQNFTQEQALHALDLIEEANRRASQQAPSRSGSAPDY
jgi:Ca-activated chloride channel family protein